MTYTNDRWPSIIIIFLVVYVPSQNAIGVVDGTHIPALIKQSKQPRYQNHKKIIFQNIMATTSFDHSFLFIYTKWKGSAADMRALHWCVKSGGFTIP